MKPLLAAICTALALSLPTDRSLAAPEADRHLPVLLAQSDRVLVRHALDLPAVRAAIARCEARGYVRRPEADAVIQSRSPVSAAVYLAFEKPGLSLPSRMVGGPVVIVATTLEHGGRPRTRVAGGLVFADLEARRFVTGDQLPQFAWSDRSFHVVESTPSIQSAGSWGTPSFDALDDTGEEDPTAPNVMRYLQCVGWGSLGCAAQAIGQPIPIPQAVVIRILVCETIVAIACLTEL